MKRLLFHANQYAAAQSLHPLWRELQGKYAIDICATGSAGEYFREQALPFCDRWERSLNEYALVVRGGYFNDAAIPAGTVPVIGMIDSWVNYLERFHNARQEFDPAYLPDYLVMPDHPAREKMLRLLAGIPGGSVQPPAAAGQRDEPGEIANLFRIRVGQVTRELRIIPSGNPTHDALTTMEYQSLPAAQLNGRILYYSEPEHRAYPEVAWYRQQEIVTALGDYAAQRGVALDIKAHPRERADAYEQILEAGRGQLIRQMAARESTGYSAVVGVMTFALIEAKLCGGRVLAAQLTSAEVDHLNFRGFGIPVCKDQADLCGKLDEYLRGDEVSINGMAAFDGKATPRLVALIDMVSGAKT